MALLGLLLVAAAAVFGTEVVLSNTQTTTGEAFTQAVAGLSAGEFFLAGAGAALVLALGLWMIAHSIGRTRARRAQARHAIDAKQAEIRETESELSSVAAENERLRAELAQERRDQLTMGGAVVPPMPVGTGGTAYDTSTYDVTDAALAARADAMRANETTPREMRTVDPYPAEVAARDHVDDVEIIDETMHTDAGRRA